MRESSNAGNAATAARTVPFHRPSFDQREIDAVADVLRSGWITTGERTAEFERRFAQYVGASHAVAFNSCTAALHVALAAEGIGPGNEVEPWLDSTVRARNSFERHMRRISPRSVGQEDIIDSDIV